MTDLYWEPSAPQPKWHQRKSSKVVMAGGVTAALVVAGLGISAAATTASDPRLEVLEAAENLKELPSSVTVSGPADAPGTFTLTLTEDGVGLSVDEPTEDIAFDVVLVQDRLFLKVDSAETDSLTANPMAAALVAGYPSIGALLDGGWVSLDVSPDSEVVAALRDLSPTQTADQEAIEAATADLRTALQGVAEDLQGPVKDSLKDHATVTEVDDSTGPEGSDHYQVSVDGEGVRTDLEPTLRDALDQVLAALDTFVAEAGAQLPGGGAEWQTARAEIVSAFEEALVEPIPAGEAADVWIADGEFTQIVTHGATLTFDADPELEAPAGAVSMDEDLLRLLPMLESFANSQELSGLGLAG